MNCFTKIFAMGLLLMMFACTSNQTTNNTTAPATNNTTAKSSANNQNNVASGASASATATTTTNNKSSVTEVKSSYKKPEELREVFTVDKANMLGQQFGDRYCQCAESKSAGECDKMMEKGVGNIKNVMKDNVRRAFEKAIDYAKKNCK